MDNKLLDKHGIWKTVEGDMEEVRGMKPTPIIVEEDPFVVLTFFVLAWVLKGRKKKSRFMCHMIYSNWIYNPKWLVTIMTRGA